MGEAGSSDLRHFRDFSFLFHFAELVVFLEGSLALASLCGISLEITTEGTEWPAQDRSITNGSRHLMPTYLRLHGPAEPPEEPAWSFARPDTSCGPGVYCITEPPPQTQHLYCLSSPFSHPTWRWAGPSESRILQLEEI